MLCHLPGNREVILALDVALEQFIQSDLTVHVFVAQLYHLDGFMLIPLSC
jgi:hypothetical protein